MTRNRKRRPWEPAAQAPRPWHERVAEIGREAGYAVTAAPEMVTMTLPGGGTMAVTASWHVEHRSPRGAVVLARQLYGAERSLRDLLRSYKQAPQGEYGDDWPI